MKSVKPILLLIDYRGAFHWKASNASIFGGLSIDKLQKAFTDNGHKVKVRALGSLDFRKDDFKDQWVLLTSSEDRNLLYKSYIEDIALALKLKGAKLIPDFEYLRAHHNKSFSEFFRDLLSCDALLSIDSKVFGTYEDFRTHELDYPRVIKVSDGSGSKGVKLALNSDEGRKIAQQFSRSSSMIEILKEMIKRLVRKGYIPRSLHRRKFIAQKFISNLSGDYKVLVYGFKYYCLERTNRLNDFRASGSGLFNFPTYISREILDYAAEVYRSFNCPCASFDIAFDGQHCYLLEFQFIHFGTYAIEKSPHYFVLKNSGWELIKGSSVVEEEFANCIVDFIQSSNGKEELYQ